MTSKTEMTREMYLCVQLSSRLQIIIISVTSILQIVTVVVALLALFGKAGAPFFLLLYLAASFSLTLANG